MKFTSWLKSTFFLMSLITGSFVFSNPADSLGVVNKGGKTFIKHKIDKGNTLYSLSKRYGVSVSSISDANPETPILKPDLILFIPTSKSVHTVVKGETLYSISRKYKLSVPEIKKHNNLTSDQLELGQQLIMPTSNTNASEIMKSTSTTNSTSKKPNSRKENNTHTVGPSETLYSIARRYDVTVPQLQALNSLTSNNLHLGQVLKIPQKTKKTQERTYDIMSSTAPELDKDFSEIISPKGKVNDIVQIIPPSGKPLYARIVKISYNDKVYASDKLYKSLNTNDFTTTVTIKYTE